MASVAATRQTMISLSSARSYASSWKRSLSVLSQPYNNRPTTSSNTTQRSRCFSKYISVTHSTPYTNSMSGQHGVQLKLALEQSRGKDNAPFDPFSQFLDMMGSASEDGKDGGLEEIEDAEFEELDLDSELDEEDSDDYDEDKSEVRYTTTGALVRPKSERHALRAGYPGGGKFAVIHLEGFQHKVTVDDLLVVNKLKPVAKWSVGSTHTLCDENVLLVADKDRTCVGLPGVKGAQVDVMVEEITRDKTVIVFKKRRRKNSRRKNGHRRQVTFLRVLGVRFPGEEKGDEADDENVKIAV